MAQNALTYEGQSQTTVSMNTLKNLWRLDAVITLGAADIMFFATGWVQDTLGMAASTTDYMRGAAIVLSIYGLWQLWVARRGSISRTSFMLAGVDMVVAATGAIALVALGVEFNALGQALMIGALGLAGYVLAALWFVGMRQAE